MKKISKILSICLICVLAIAGAITGFVLINNKGKDEDPKDPVFENSIYYATAEESTGADSAPLESKGGALYISGDSTDSEVVFDGGTLQYNEAKYGGAVYIADGGKFIMNGGTIQLNFAQYGGAIYVAAGGELVINGGTISFNRSQFRGAVLPEGQAYAVYVEDGGIVTIDDENVTMQENIEVLFGDHIVNYYVDGELYSSVTQNAQQVDPSNALQYDACNGYFQDPEMTIPVEQGEVLTSLAQSYQATNSAGAPQVYNLYTSAATVDKLDFEIKDNGECVAKAKNTSITGKVTIPRQYNGIDVVGLAEYSAFESCDAIEECYLNNIIEVIPDSCFYGTSFSKLNLPETVLSIQPYAFWEASITKLTIPKSVNSIEVEALAGMNSLESIVVSEENSVYDSRNNCNAVIETTTNTLIAGFPTTIIPSSVKTIGVEAFCALTLNEVVVPEGVETLDDAAFFASDINTLILPESLTKVESGAFTMASVTNLTIKKGLESLTTKVFVSEEDEMLPITNLTIDMPTIRASLYDFPTLKTLTIGENVTTIESGAFSSSASSVKEITVNATLSSNTLYKYLPIASVEKLTFNGKTAFPAALSQLATLKEIVLGENCTSIGQRRFAQNKVLEKITIGSGVKTISAFAFQTCSSLNEVIMPETGESSLTTLEQGVFYGCSSLTEITLPGTISTVGNQLFNGCSNLKTVVFENGIKELKTNMFLGCSSIEKVITSDEVGDSIEGCVVLPLTLNAFGNTVFKNCTSLVSATIPATLTTWGTYTFSGCSNLTSVFVQDGVEIIPTGTFDNCDALTSIVKFSDVIDDNYTGKVVLPESSLTTISTKAFQNCGSITDVKIPGSITDWNSLCFYNCASLATVVIEDGVSSIPTTAFSGCSKLTQVELPSTLTYIGSEAFVNCVKLDNVVIPGSVTTWNSGVFNGCVGLTKITIENGVSSIPSSVFSGCSNLKTVILSDNITAIPSYAFQNCSSITDIVKKSDITDGNYEGKLVVSDSLSSIGSYAFNNCSGLLNIVIPGAVTSWQSNAFTNCSNLNSVIIENGVSTIPSSAFLGCSKLATVVISNNVTVIPASAFQDCSALTQVVKKSEVTDGNYEGKLVLPNSLLTISSAAFKNCSNLLSLTIPASVTTIESSAFSGNSKLVIKVEEGMTSLPSKAFAGLTNITSVLSVSDVEEGDDLAGCVILPTSLKTISNSAFENCSNLTNVQFVDVTTIGARAFMNCSGIQELTIPDNITTIDVNAFIGCGLKTLTVGSGLASVLDTRFTVTNIETLNINTKDTGTAFIRATALKTLILGDNVKTTSYDGFRGCTSLSSVTFGTGITTLAKWLFAECSSLKNITLPTNIKTLDEGAFYHSGLTSFTASATLTTLGNSVFSGCESLESVDLSNSKIKTIPTNAVKNCSNLKEFKFSPVVTSIKTEAFNYCLELESIHIPATITSISASAFRYMPKLTSLVVDPENTKYRSIENAIVQEKTFTVHGKSVTVDTIIMGCAGTTISEGSTVRAINNYAFMGSGIQNINLKNICYIGLCAFTNSDKLESVSFSSELEVIRFEAFKGCVSLANVKFTDNNEGYSSLTKIHGSAFLGCVALTSIELPQTLQGVWSYAFNDTGLTSVSIPASVFRIGANSFNTCSSVVFEDKTQEWHAYLYGEDDSIIEDVIVNVLDSEALATEMKGEREKYYYLRWDNETAPSHYVRFYNGETQIGPEVCISPTTPFSLKFAPLDSDECNGYYIDSAQTIKINEGDVIATFENITITTRTEVDDEGNTFTYYYYHIYTTPNSVQSA